MRGRSRMNLVRAAVVSFFLVSLFWLPAAEAKTFKLLSSWPENMIFVEGCYKPFSANLKELSKAQLETKFFGPDVIPTMEQFQPLQSGAFDLLYTIPAYHLGATAAGTGIDAIKPDPTQVRRTGVFDFIDRLYQKQGAKLIAIVPITDLHFLSRVPIDNNQPSFKGVKVRTTPTIAPLVEKLGGAAVNLPSGEVYTALQKGVIDAATIITFGAVDYKWYEVTKYMVRPTFGYISTLILMNLKKFEQLTPEEKSILVKVGEKTELDAREFFKEKKAAEDKQLKELGMKETFMQPADAAQADRIYMETIWEMSEKKSGEEIKKLHELAKSKGLTQ
ncbi:MAG: TRAP transporter substrate-binding protein DctP [Thermodesulfobacteriota bacterium]